VSDHGHPFHFHSTWALLGGCGRMFWLDGSFLLPFFLFHLVGVVCLCGGMILGCKQQNQSCFLLPVKAYRIAWCVEGSQQVKLYIHRLAQLSENKHWPVFVMLWLGLALLQQNYSWALYTRLQNILAQHYFGSLMYLGEKSKNCEYQTNCKGM